MYVIYVGFSKKQKEVFDKWNEGLTDSFTTKDSIAVGRLVSISKSWMDKNQLDLQKVIEKTRAFELDEEEYLPYLKETRYFYSKEINQIFSVEVEESNDKNKLDGMVVTVFKIPFLVFFRMIDSQDLMGYLGTVEGKEDGVEEDYILMEKGFLNNYLTVRKISPYSGFLMEGRNFNEFREVVHFVVELGTKIGWKWRNKKKDDEEEDGEE